MIRVGAALIALAASAAALVPTVLAVRGTDTIVSIAGTGVAGAAGDGGPALQAQLNAPLGVALDPQGRVLIADFANHRVRRVASNGVITTIAGTGTAGFSGDGGPATAAQLSAPYDVAADAAGNIYICDQNNFRIRKVSPTGIITTVAVLGLPQGIDVDPDGNLYVVDQPPSTVVRITPPGTATTVAGTGTAGYSGDGGPATEAQLRFPAEVALGADGRTLLIADQGNHRVRRVAPDGTIATIAGTGTPGFSGDGGPATLARLDGPRGVEQDAAGNVYISDNTNRRVRKIDAAGVIRTVAGSGGAAPVGDGGEAAAASVGPRSLAVDRAGSLVIADALNHRIRRVLNLAPVAAFAAFPTNGPVPLTVAVDGSASTDPNGAVVGHEWDFGDGARGVGARVQHVYAAPGHYTVRLTVRDDSGATATTSKTVSATAPGAGAASPLVLSGVSFDVRWKASRLVRGRLVVAGGSTRAATLRVRLRRSGRTVLTRRVRVRRPGLFVQRLRLPARSLPGRYLVRIDEPRRGSGTLPAQERRAVLAPPREGVVARAFVSGKIGGRALRRIGGRPSIIFAHFTFAARPAPGQRLTVQWFPPGARRAVAVTRKPIRTQVIAFIKARGPLPRGRWRAELRYGGKLVATAPVRLG